ncbi:transposase [Streptomyces sp. AS02]|uniref:transposase n=1 Tax=Streptomyces sp. AS02 TaxID=2938946 RepID=UPI0027B96517|nr:transposase [Streptomyces sp. AS02]
MACDGHRVARGDLAEVRRVGAGCAVPDGQEARPSTGWSRRQPVGGMRFRVRTGIPWRDVPAQYDGPWIRVYDLFRRWQSDSIWRILRASQT